MNKEKESHSCPACGIDHEHNQSMTPEEQREAHYRYYLTWKDVFIGTNSPSNNKCV